MIRLQKYMADCGVASRRACESIIESGRVLVNGSPASLGQSVNPDKDKVTLDGKLLSMQKKHIVVMLYKPRGVVSTSEDEKGRKTVQEYVKDLPYRLYNVGRLDLNSEGLLLLTNDGELANQLMHPRYGVSKTYRVVCDGTLSAGEIALLTNGVELEDGLTAPAKVTNIRRSTTGGTAFSITIHEGRNRQIRRMLEAIGHKTLRLKREAYGPLQLGSMKPGEWRILNEPELDALKKQIKTDR
ncbi:MAG: rRNA pseudouridine synthase [Clostridia bacterium]|nr:rRNA pseudouridine synthase [Clostridia bacterium]